MNDSSHWAVLDCLIRSVASEKSRVYINSLDGFYITPTEDSCDHYYFGNMGDTSATGAGLVNLYADNETQYPERNLEDVITKNPDIIVKLLGSSAALDDAAYSEYKTGLAGVAAADNDKIILLNNECGTTAIGAVIGRLYVAKYAYPELFADLDVDAVYEKLCTEFFGKEYTGSGAFTK